MSLKNTVGVDHVVISVRDLDAAAVAWRGLGFTLSPPGIHSAHLGTGNYTLMLGDDYIELLGVLKPTDYNIPVQDFLRQREGLERTAFTAIDAAALVDELKARGAAATGPVEFGRPVKLPDGREIVAKFRTAYWPVDQRIGGMRLFACQHFTREAVWQPDLQRHANGAVRIAEIEIVATAPQATAAQLSAMIDQPIARDQDGALRVASGGDRADFIVATPAQFVARHPSVALDDVPSDAAVGLVLRVRDDAKLNTLAWPKGAWPKGAWPKGAILADGVVTVPPSAANGILLTLSEG
jgi:catechol 2,3-dioxygenase-like lactoylglutathione lyase family enzyme